MPKKYKRILVINTFGIGDVLFSTPMLKVLKANMPHASIDFICNKRCQDILVNNKNINEVIVFEKDEFREAFRKSKVEFIKKICQFIQKIKQKRYELAMDLSLGYRASLLFKLLGIKRRIGFNYRNRGKFLTDKIDMEGFDKKKVPLYHMDLLKALDIDIPKGVFPEVFASEEDDRWARDLMLKLRLEDKFIIGIAPGGGRSWGSDSRYRRWPVSNFAHVADKLMDKFGIPVLLFGDKDERKLCVAMQRIMHNKSVDMAGKTNVSQFMSLVKRCGLILCNEGGPLHIAVALGIPTASIFGPVDEIIYGPCTADASKHAIITDRRKCSPCYSKFKHKKCDTLICLESISEDKVFNTVSGLLNKVR